MLGGGGAAVLWVTGECVPHCSMAVMCCRDARSPARAGSSFTGQGGRNRANKTLRGRGIPVHPPMQISPIRGPASCTCGVSKEVSSTAIIRSAVLAVCCARTASLAYTAWGRVPHAARRRPRASA